MQNKKGVLLVNLGTPDSPSVADVRKYLREFLMDERVIDIPFLSRWFLVNVIIATFRGPKSAKEYQKLWDERGSPLKFYSEDLVEGVRKELGEGYEVVLGMRYQNPSIAQALTDLRKAQVSSIKVIPLFPQYASATTGSVIQKVMSIIGGWQTILPVNFISQFFDHDLLIDAIASNAKKYIDQTEYDHFLFSYHGLPERQIYKAEIKGCELGNCCDNFTGKNRYCYRAQCIQTTKLLVEKIGIADGKYTTVFQSRLGKDPWIQPYVEPTIMSLAEKGVKKVLVFSPAFVADCLETTLEVGETYGRMFVNAGGEQWDLVESLNANPKWVTCVSDLVRNA